ncbi:2307_t:CDS:2 [Ambispora gerdemannii]|uniref:2307_t:CDS:1 n=1 Tax=Ambispora gerdemannii TaxID=144530 RepID=A0A9N9A3K3_9GLOM|nr:2307_t:CDS:2 [Ambispora gerdemannii]
METPTISVITAAHTVDYLGHNHTWSETDVVYTHTEVKKEIAAFRSKCREEHEKPEYLAIVAKHEDIERRKAQKALRKQNTGKDTSEVPTVKASNPFSSATPLVEKRVNAAGQTVTKKVKDPLKKVQREEWLQEKRLLRQENALWRRMGVVKSGRLVSPQSLNWQKECDVLWLFGPLYQPEEHLDEDDDSKNASSSTIDGIPNYASPIKPALKKHVEHSPIEDLLTYYKCSKVLNKDKSVTSIDRLYKFDAADYSSSSEESDVTDAEDSDSGSNSDSSTCFSDHSLPTRRHTMPVRIPSHVMQKNKKSLRFSSKLEQVHYYAPTNYTKPPTRRRSNPQRTTKKDLTDESENIDPTGAGVAIGIKGVGMMDTCNDYDQIFKWAKSQVRTSGTYNLFCEDDKKGAPANTSIAAYQATMDAIEKKTAAANHMTTNATANGAMEYQKMLAAAKASTTRRRQSTQYSKPIYDVELLSSDEDDEAFFSNKKSSNKTVVDQEKEADPFCPPPIVEDTINKDTSKEDASIVARCVNIAENAKDVHSFDDVI